MLKVYFKFRKTKEKVRVTRQAAVGVTDRGLSQRSNTRRSTRFLLSEDCFVSSRQTTTTGGAAFTPGGPLAQEAAS